MNAEIIAVGSELLLGQIANTNAQFLSKELAEIGVNVYYHTVVGDNPERLRGAIEIAQKRSNLILFSGGLGPTKDDLTKETVAEIIRKKLVTDDFALEQIVGYFKKVKREMSENNKKQALVVEGSTIFPNDNGMAPGMGFSADSIHYIMMPGPPRELTTMFSTYIKSHIMELIGMKGQIHSRVLRFFGIGESQLETDLIDLIERQSNPTIAPLAKSGEVTLRLTAKAGTVEEADVLINEVEKEILDRVGRYFYGYGETSLDQTLFNLLVKKQKTIASAESLTGGLFNQILTSFPGASNVVNGGIVCYTNESKTKLAHVDPSILADFGAVSKECALALAKNVRELLGSDIGVSFTGVAGPDKSEGKEAGTVYIGISLKEGDSLAFEHVFPGGRQQVRERTVKTACSHLLKVLK